MTTSTTTTTHRPRCERPGWDVEPTRSITGLLIARCRGCGAVELRKAEPKPMNPTENDRRASARKAG